VGIVLGVVGVLWGFNTTSSLIPAVIMGMAWGVSSFVAFSGEGMFYDIPIGWLVGMVLSGMVGGIIGIVYWVQGAEQPINSEILFFGLEGLRLGARNAVAGSLLGFLLRRIMGGRHEK